MSRLIILLAIICNTSFLSHAIAASPPNDAGGGFSQIFKQIFGKDSARKNPSSSADCQGADQNGGAVGIINGFFCHMRYDMGITSVGSVTKTFGNGTTFTVKVHGEINASGCTGWDGTTYNNTASVWVCNTATADCTKAANFGRVVSACFSSASDYSINKGALIMDFGPFNGGSAGSNGVSVSYDLGTASSAQKITMKMYSNNGGSPFAMRMDGTRSDKNHLTATMLMVNGGTASSTSAARFAFALDRNANTANAYFEGFGATGGSNGIGTFSATASGDAPSTGACLTRTSDGQGDFTYTVSSTGASCAPAVTFPSDSLNTVAAYSATTIDGTWNGMAANPTSI